MMNWWTFRNTILWYHFVLLYNVFIRNIRIFETVDFIFKEHLSCTVAVCRYSISSLFCILTCAIIYVLMHRIFLVLSLLLRYSLFFSSTHILTSSIDLILVLSISANILLQVLNKGGVSGTPTKHKSEPLLFNVHHFADVESSAYSCSFMILSVSLRPWLLPRPRTSALPLWWRLKMKLSSRYAGIAPQLKTASLSCLASSTPSLPAVFSISAISVIIPDGQQGGGGGGGGRAAVGGTSESSSLGHSNSTLSSLA